MNFGRQIGYIGSAAKAAAAEALVLSLTQRLEQAAESIGDPTTSAA